MAYIGREPQIGNFQVCDAITTSATDTYNLLVGSVAVSPETANHCIVSLNGVIQAPTSAFTISGSTIVFASALTSSDVIDFIQILGSVLDLGVPSDDTVSTAKIVDANVTLAKLSATGTKDATTFLRGDNTFAAAGGGKINQVVTQTLTSITSISAGSFIATGLTLNITPSASNSKIYLIASISVSGSTNDYNQSMAFFRDSTIIGAAADASSRIGSMSQSRTNNSIADSVVLSFVDSPSSTSQLTYTVKLYGEAGITHYVNRTGGDADQAHKGRTTSTITALEVLV